MAYEVSLKLSHVNNGDTPRKVYTCYEVKRWPSERRNYCFDVWAASLEDAEKEAREVLKTRRFTMEE